MGELIEDVAGVINHLCSLNLLRKESVTTYLEFDDKTEEFTLQVSVPTQCLSLNKLCCGMFQELMYPMLLDKHDTYISVTFIFRQ